MKKQISRSIKAHLLPNLFVLLSLLAIGVIPFVQAQRNDTAKSAAKSKAAASVAAKPTTTGPASSIGRPPAPAAPNVVLWDQYDNASTTATLSATFTDFPTFNADLADDFVVPAGCTWNVTSIDADGIYFNGPGPATSFNVYIYNNASCTPATVVCSSLNQPFTQSGTTFTVNLTPACVLPAGTYWVEIQANMTFNPAGEWGWTDRTLQCLCPAVWQNTGGGFGPPCQTWMPKLATCVTTAGGPDQVYRLNGTTTGNCTGVCATPSPTPTPCPPYVTSTITNIPITSGTTDTGNHCDDCVTAITFPFPVSVYGTVFNSANVSSNGSLDLTGTQAPFTHGCVVLPSTNWSHAILPYQDDLRTDDNGGVPWPGCNAFPGSQCGVFTSTTGSAPNRNFNIEWRATHFDDTTTSANFEVVFTENDPTHFCIIYGETNDEGSDETSGWQASSTGPATQFSCGGTVSRMRPPGTKVTYTLVPCQLTCAPAPSGFTLWLPFDELSGTTSANLYPVGNIGTNINSPAHIAGVYVDNSLSFNGTQSVSVPDYLDINPGTGNFSIDAWVKRDLGSGNSPPSIIVDKRAGSNFNTAVGYSLSVSFGRLFLSLNDGGGFTNYGETIGSIPADGNWHFVAVTVNRTSQTGIQFYVDGVLTATGDPRDRPGCLTNRAASFIVAASPIGGNQPWFGGIDEVEFFPRVLTGDEIVSIYSAGSAGKCKCVPPPSDFKLWLPLDELSGSGTTSVNFYYPPNKNGTQNNSPTVTSGYVDHSLCFDGTQSVTVPRYAAIEPGLNQDFSIDAWVKRDLASGNSPPSIIVDKRFGSDFNTAVGYSLSVSFGRLFLSLNDGGGFTNYGETIGSIPADGNWHFVAVTVNRTSQTGIQFYVDGVVTATGDPRDRPGSLSNLDAPFTVAASPSTPGNQPWLGCIDEVEFFSRVLTVQEIESIYGASHAGKCRPVPTVVRAVSRKNHGACGTFDIPLPLTCPAGVECRSGGATGDYTMVVTFSDDVTVTGTPNQAEVICRTGTSIPAPCVGTGGGCTGTVSVSGTDVTVPLTNVSSAENITVRIIGVNSTTDVDIPMGILVGDVNGNCVINSSDVALCKSQAGQTVTAANFRCDVNTNCVINSADIALIKQRSGTSIPCCCVCLTPP